MSLRVVNVLLALVASGCAGSPSEVEREPNSPRAEAFLDTLQERTFGYFWELTDAENGLTPDRWPTESFSSVAAVGFALTAYPVGVERGWVTRSDAAARVRTTLEFLWEAPQGDAGAGITGHRGFFYHFLDMETGHRFREVELSTIDTALLLGGILMSQQYFDGEAADEAAIRALADSIYLRVDWTFAQARPPLLSLGWHPESGFISTDWTGYSEAMLLYILALGSPTHPIAPEAWDAWTGTYAWGGWGAARSDSAGEPLADPYVTFGPMFGHQYSHVWIDFRGIQDGYMRGRGIDYFENSRRAVLDQHAYAVRNPGGWTGYGDRLWGLTASDGPAPLTREVDGVSRRFDGYRARGIPFDGAPYTPLDDGTIAPTAVGGSVPFVPAVTIPALIELRERYGETLYSTYGYFDAFNPTFTFEDVTLTHGQVDPELGWFDTDYLGIDQGPILLMIENHRTGFVWETMRESPYLVAGLCRAGFEGGWLEGRCQ